MMAFSSGFGVFTMSGEWQPGVSWAKPGVGNGFMPPPRQRAPSGWEGAETSSHGHQLPQTQLLPGAFSDHPRAQRPPPQWGEDRVRAWLSEQIL